LSENFTEDKDDKCLRGHNISLESIYEKASEFFSNVETKCNQILLFKMLKRMFPCVSKSQVKEKGLWKKSVKGIKMDLTPNMPEMDTCENFLDIPNYITPEWNVLEKSCHVIRLGCLSVEIFNGNPVQTQLIIDNNGSIQVFVAGKQIDISIHFISTKVRFNQKSLLSLFRCLKTISLCHGAVLKPFKQDIYSSSKKVVKEVSTIGTETKTVIRHIDCVRVVPLTSQSSSCHNCLQFKQYKKRDHSRNLVGPEKENVKPNVTKNADMAGELKKIAPNLSQNQLTLIASQIEASECKTSKGMRWPKEVICMTLTLYNRNPSAYRDITKNGWLNLPSESLLYLYKNAIKQKPGIIPDMMSWMYKEAIRQKVCEEGFYGGIILDEMSIQEDIQIVKQGKDSTLVGLVDCEPDIMIMHNANEGSCQNKLADHVLQYVFHGVTGFRWPFANYPNAQAAPADIFVSTWKCVDALFEWNFKPIYCCVDGSSNNRAFLKMHFPENQPLCTNMVASHYKNPFRKLIFIMDPCHLIKKIRNSLLSSGIKDQHQRLLTIDGCTINWQMWIDAYHWDRNCHSFPIHHKLTDEHLFPNNAQKMRNKLAFETLNDDMLHLMKSYQRSLSDAGQQALSAVIQLLEHVSFLVSFFTDERPVKDLCDERMDKLTLCYNWFKSWEKQICQSETVSKRYKTLMTMETREDLDFMYYGFMSLTKMCIEEIHTEIVPARLNSDIIENVFCQQRGLYHGATTHPTYNSYRTGINSVILGEALISRKCNSGGAGAKPFVAEVPQKKLSLRL